MNARAKYFLLIGIAVHSFTAFAQLPGNPDSLLKLKQPDFKFPLNIKSSSNPDSSSQFGIKYKLKCPIRPKMELPSVNPKDSLTRLRDNSKKKPRILKSFSANVINSVHYGAIPYYLADAQLPAKLYQSTGDFKYKIGKIPLTGDYFYAAPKFASGLNNYFTIRFDAEEYLKEHNEENLKKCSGFRKQFDSLGSKKNLLKQEMAMAHMAKINPTLMPAPRFEPKTKSLDSIPFTVPSDSIQIPINPVPPLIPRIDTSAANLRKLQHSIEEIEKRQRQLQNQIDAFEYPQKPTLPGAKTSFKKQKPLDGIHKFEIGMCYPGFSTFMINQTPLKGLNVGYEIRKMFFDFAAGKTLSTNSIQPHPNLIFLRNPFELFDRSKEINNNVMGSTRIAYGNRSKSFMSAGLLAAKDLRHNQLNYVFEIASTVKVKFLTVEAAVAQSTISNISVPVQQEVSTTGSIKQKWNRSYMIKASGKIPKTQTNFTLLSREVQPFFKSLGSNFMRSDVRRNEVKVDQPLGKIIKITIQLRRDKDNIKFMQNYGTTINNLFLAGRTKIWKKRLDLMLSYGNIVQHTSDRANNTINNTTTEISSLIISYTPRLKRFNSSTTFIVNNYSIRSQEQQNSFINYSLNSFNQIGKIQLNFMNSYNHSTLKDSLNFANSITNAIELSWPLKNKYKIISGVKHAYLVENHVSKVGYSLTFDADLHKLCRIEVKFDKLIVGDFLTTLNYNSINAFPYLVSCKISHTF